MKTTKKQRIMFNWQCLENFLPPDVANKWNFGNTKYPEIKQRSQEETDRKMIILHGAENTGKTTAIESVFVALVFAQSPFQNISYNFVGGATIGADRNDIFAVVDVFVREKGKVVRLGFCSAGDYPGKWLKKIDDILIKSAKCDIIICVARQEQVLNMLKGYAKESGYSTDVHPAHGNDISENLQAYRQFIFKELGKPLNISTTSE